MSMGMSFKAEPCSTPGAHACSPKKSCVWYSLVLVLRPLVPSRRRAPRSATATALPAVTMNLGVTRPPATPHRTLTLSLNSTRLVYRRLGYAMAYN